MKIPELEAILALCKAAPFVQSSDVAGQLLSRLSPYLPESYSQILAPSPSLRYIDPSPYEVLTGNLTSAILSIGTRHDTLRARANSAINTYLNGWSETAAQLSADQFDGDEQVDHAAGGELSQVMTLSLSLLGFLGAVSKYAGFWNAYDGLQIVQNIRAALSEKFLIAFETALSIARNARPYQDGLREWRRYAKHYAATGRPLGGMILHDSFLKVVVACASLLIETTPREPEESVLDFLRSSSFKSAHIVRAQSEDALCEGLTTIAIEEMERLENDVDYLQRVGSAWQQRQGAEVKAKILTTYLCCTAYDEEVADSDLLMSWLDTALNDPAQTSDYALASTILKSMATLAKLDSSMASTLGRTLPRVIVQGGFDHRTSDIAADCLASVLSLLPQDAIITTLYSLGNVISAGPVTNGGTASPALNSGGKASRNTLYGDPQTTGSAISLTPSDIEDPHHVHATVIQTVVYVARNCKDEKIAGLALSMLIQKIGRATRSVDAKIITDCARLGIHAGRGDFKLLLKLYTKLCHDAILKDDSATLEAVSYSAHIGCNLES
jgi:phosphatidylinositol 4-kinase